MGCRMLVGHEQNCDFLATSDVKPSTWSTTAWTVISDFQTTTEDLFVQQPQCIETLTVG